MSRERRKNGLGNHSLTFAEKCQNEQCGMEIPLAFSLWDQKTCGHSGLVMLQPSASTTALLTTGQDILIPRPLVDGMYTTTPKIQGVSRHILTGAAF